jgi:nicotinate-nucleotide adenylyltransferase
MPLGVLGGAFNPPHIGHLVLAQEAAAQLGLDRVLMVPTGRAPHKDIADDPGRSTRLELTRVAAAGNGLLEVDPFEVDAAGSADEPSYTVSTLEEVSRRDRDLVLLMGADVAAHLDDWHLPERVLELARVGVAGRPGTGVDEAEATIERLGAAKRAEIVRMPELGVSSTRIRRRVAQGRPVRYLVTDGVLELIEAEGLYR